MAVSVKIKKQLDNFLLDISFASEARRIGILGASGGGKSMTLKCIAGIASPDEGEICLENRIMFSSCTGTVRKKKVNLKPQERNVGYLFQNYALFPTMTVEKNIAAGLKGNKKENKERVSEMIRKFRLQGLESRLPAQLSGGQQQRVALARIMAYEPDMILLDEPFSALDLYLKDQLQREMIRMLEDYRGTVILVSHNRDEVYRFSDELLIIDEGKIIASGETKKIFQNPEKKEAARLTGCKNFSKIEKTGIHTFYAVDWNVELHVQQTVPDDAGWLGYRAHDFLPVWGEEGENMIKFDLDSSASLPFENNYYIKCRSAECSDAHVEEDPVICWFVQRDQAEKMEEKGMPDYLLMKEEKMLFLTP